MSSNKQIEEIIKNRIAELNKADAAFCNERWADHIPLGESIKKQIAREESNKVTFARQELESILDKLLQPTATEDKSIEEMAENKPVDTYALGYNTLKPILGTVSLLDVENFQRGYKANTVNKELLFAAQNSKTEIEWWMKEFKGLTKDDLTMMRMTVETLQTAISKAELLKQ